MLIFRGFSHEGRAWIRKAVARIRAFSANSRVCVIHVPQPIVARNSANAEFLRPGCVSRFTHSWNSSNYRTCTRTVKLGRFFAHTYEKSRSAGISDWPGISRAGSCCRGGCRYRDGGHRDKLAACRFVARPESKQLRVCHTLGHISIYAAHLSKVCSQNGTRSLMRGLNYKLKVVAWLKIARPPFNYYYANFLTSFFFFKLHRLSSKSWPKNLN